MKTEELIRLLQERGFTGAHVVGIDVQGITYSIKDVEIEHHEDAGGAVTVWLRLDEN